MIKNDRTAPLHLPESVRSAVERVLGPLTSREPLGGLSGSLVQRLRSKTGRAVLKGGVRAAEAEFYRVVAPLLAGQGIVVPDLLWSGRAAGRRWLLLEDVPNPLPRDRWGDDEELLAVLARLHASRSLPRLRSRDAYRPVWPDRLTASALGALPADDAVRLGPVLASLRAASPPIFMPRCLISGDANPNNWGLRADGTLMLFDWERYTRGTPALDLAPVVPGLGTAEEFATLARAYIASGGTDGSGALAREIGLAKVWTAVELLAGIAEGQVADGPVVTWLRSAFPDWIHALSPTISEAT